MTVPTSGESFAKLIEHLRLAQEEAYTLNHLERANGKISLADGWFSVGELLKRMIYQVTQLATKRLQ